MDEFGTDIQIMPDGMHHMTELQTQEHQENRKANKCSSEKTGRVMEETGKDLCGGAALFLFNFYVQAVGAVKSHFNTGKKTHQTKSKDKEYYGLPVDHKVKIINGEWGVTSGGLLLSESHSRVGI